jgi:hypothetical protein
MKLINLEINYEDNEYSGLIAFKGDDGNIATQSFGDVKARKLLESIKWDMPNFAIMINYNDFTFPADEPAAEPLPAPSAPLPVSGEDDLPF